jgi:hypothetical protein
MVNIYMGIKKKINGSRDYLDPKALDGPLMLKGLG